MADVITNASVQQVHADLAHLTDGTQVALDAQRVGWRDDGTEAGRLRMEVAASGWQMAPLREGHYQTGGDASFTMNYGNDAAKRNLDGSLSALFVSVAQGTGHYGTLRVPFRGTGIGFRYERNYNYPNVIDPQFLVDGQPVSAPSAWTLWDTQSNSYTGSAGFGGVILATDLAEGEHWLDIVLPASATAATAILLYGLLVSSLAGYPAQPRLQTIRDVPQSVPTSAGSLSSFLLAPGAPRLSAIRKIDFVNVGASAINVTLTTSSANGSVVIWGATVPAGTATVPGIATFDPGGLTALDLTLTLVASASGLKAVTYGIV